MELQRQPHLPYAGSVGSAGAGAANDPAPADSAPGASSPIVVLPLELRRAIVRLLPQHPRFLFGLLLLSRAWYDAVLPFLWSSMPLRQLLHSPTWKATIAMHATFITHLDIRLEAAGGIRPVGYHTTREEMYESIDWLFRRSGVSLPGLRSLSAARVTRTKHIGTLHHVAVTNPNIHSLTIDLCRRFRRLTDASRPPSHPPLFRQLQNLEVRYTMASPPLSSLPSLLCLTQLTSLKMYTKVKDMITLSPLYFLFSHVAFTEDALLNVIRQAPQLQELVVVLGLGSRVGGDGATFITSLVAALPDLRILKLGFPVPPLEEPTGDESPVVPHQALRLLAVGDSIFDDDPSHDPSIEWYSELLRRAFPNLEVYKFGLFLKRGVWNIQRFKKPVRLTRYLTQAEVFNW